MAIDSGSAKMSDASLTSLVGILSIPGAFLEFRVFRMVLIAPTGARYRNGIGL